MKKTLFRPFFASLLAVLMLFAFSIQPFGDFTYHSAFAEQNGKGINLDISGNDTNTATEKKVLTLITGDVVTVSDIGNGKSVISVEPAPNSDGAIQVLTLGDNTFVIPSEAMSYLASDLLDKNLFNITKLIADGYDDENKATLPVIVQYHETNTRSLTSTLAGAEQTNVLNSINAVAVNTDKEKANLFWADFTDYATTESSRVTGGIKKVWLDGRVEAYLAESVPQIGAPAAWESHYNGEGVTVAVLDSGIDTEHPDLKEQIIEAKSFVEDETDEVDYHGHGTHVSSTVLGTGAASDGRNKGVAPGAKLYSGKVLDRTGYGQESWIIVAMEWAAENADIVNMSLGNPGPSDGTDPMSQAVNELSAKTGTLFVIAAGNSGSEGIGSPGAANAALTVGNVDKGDNLAFSSSRGPRFMNDGLKPDLTAPGTDILAARSQLTFGDGFYTYMSGTSMASPHVAGAAAILKQVYPDWTGEQLKAALMSSTKKIDSITPYQGGTGRLDIEAAITRTVFASGSLDFGFFDWPHENDAMVEKTVTYKNIGDEEVTLDLTATFKDNDGAASPEGVLKLSTDQVIVPAGESVEITVTFDPNLADIGQRYQGHLSAVVAGEVVAVTAMAVGKEAERNTLTINATDSQGAPGQMVVTIVGADFEPQFFSLYGQTELRLEPGTYSIMGMMDIDKGTDHAGVAVLGNPEIILDRDKTVHLDAQDVNEISAMIPDKNKADFKKLELFRSFGGSKALEFTYVIPETIDKMYAQQTDPVTQGMFELNTRWRLSKPALTIDVDGIDINNTPLPGGTLFEGEFKLPIVYAGNGTTNEYKDIDVKDKAVLIHRSNEITGSDRAEAALAAGAKLLLIINDEDSKFTEWVGKPDYMNSNPIAVTSLSGIEGAKVIDAAIAGDLTINVDSTLVSPYIYDLVDIHKNTIPENLTYSPSQDELVKIDAQYYSDRAIGGMEFRWDIPSYRDNGIGFMSDLALPTVRTEWVSASEGTHWHHAAQVNDEWGTGIWEVRHPAVSYQPGERLKENWFSAVVRPRLGDGFWVPERFGNDLQFNIPSWADGVIDSTGWMFNDPSAGEEVSLELYRGNTLLESSNDQTLFHNDAEAESTEYRLVSDASRDSERWSTSVSTHTEWTIWTKKQEEFHTFLPMISLDYLVDTDMNGIAVGGDRIKLGLLPSQIDYASDNGIIDGATLEVSFDEGKKWEEVQLTQKGDGWEAEISNSAPGKYASLRASAWDDLGNKIEQTIIKAFGLPETTVDLSTDKAEYSLQTGATQQIKVTETTTTIGDDEPTSVDVTKEATYVVADEKIASIKEGLITAKAKGSTEIVISHGGQEVTVKVTVTDPYIPGPGPSPDPGPSPGPTPDPNPETPVFTDITNTFAKDEINKLAAKGIIQGKTDTEFAPNASITRAEFTVLLARALDLPLKSYEGKFTDVNTSKKWAYAGIEAAATAGIVNGTLDGKFNPDAPIKREEIAAMVVRAVEYKEKSKLENLEKPAEFIDHSSIGAYAIDSVYKATALGVIKGNDGKFNPKNNATRAEAAVMLYRALDTLKLLD